jgi:hypothetical protein
MIRVAAIPSAAKARGGRPSHNTTAVTSASQPLNPLATDKGITA